ncbi:MAG: efflux RND transporter permease subunit [Rhizobiaceae bacterium]
MRLNSLAVRHRRSILLLVAAAIVGGVMSILQLPVSLFPKVDFPRVEVSVDAGSRPAPQMEMQVTRPIEEALRAIPGVRNVRSTTSRGSADVSIDFDWGANMVQALLQVDAKLSQISGQLPAGTSYTARRMDPEVFPIIAFSLTSAKLSPIQLRDLAQYQIAPALSTVSGVAHVAVQGGDREEYRVQIDPGRLRAHGLSIVDVARALKSSNVLTAVGRLQDHHRLFLVLSNTQFSSLDRIQHAVLKSGSDGMVELQDVATVGVAPVPQWIRVVADGKDAVLLPVFQQPGSNTVAIGAALKAKLAELSKSELSGVTVHTWYNQGVLVSSSVASVRDAIGIGVGLAAVVLLVFLRNWKIMAIGILVVPAVLAATGLLLHLFGMGLNIMTLGGAAAAVGLIIDDTIVMVEHIVRKLRGASASPEGAVMRAAAEMTRPLVGSSASTIIIFLPLAFLTGVTGAFFKALSMTMASALIISFLIAWLVVPLIAGKVLGAKDTVEKHSRVGRSFMRRYRATVAHGLRRPWLALLLVLPLAGGGYFAFTQVGAGFIPSMDEGGFILDYRTPPGTSLDETDRVLREIGGILRETPEVRTWSRRTGLQLGGGLTEANTGDFFVRLKPLPRRPIEEVMSEVRAKIAKQVPGVQVETAQLMEDLIGDLTAVPQPIEIKLFGAAPDVLRALAPKVAAAIGKIPGIVEVKDGIVIAGDALEVHVDRDRAAIAGITPEEVTTQLDDYVSGNVASQVERTTKMVGIRVWAPRDERSTATELGKLQLRASDGHLIPLERVATIKTVTGQPEIDRENLRPMVAVTARVEGRSVGQAAAQVEQVLRSGKLIPSGVTYELGGLYKQQRIAMHDLTIVFAAAVVLVFILLLFLYEDFVIASAIMAMPLIAIGAVFIGLWLTGTERNITAMMGLTMVIGIVTEIAIFYFSEFQSHDRQGMRALIKSAGDRFRPIAMTTIAAILALLPLSLGIGQGSAMLKPLAIAIISGLIVQIPLVLWVLPVVYGSLRRVGQSHTGVPAALMTDPD